jgi:hypothetical protein
MTSSFAGVLYRAGRAHQWGPVAGNRGGSDADKDPSRQEPAATTDEALLILGPLGSSRYQGRALWRGRGRLGG